MIVQFSCDICGHKQSAIVSRERLTVAVWELGALIAIIAGVSFTVGLIVGAGQ
jgi:hypothetical protein